MSRIVRMGTTRLTYHAQIVHGEESCVETDEH